MKTNKAGLGFRRHMVERMNRKKEDTLKKIKVSLNIVFKLHTSIPWLGCSSAEPTSALKCNVKLDLLKTLLTKSYSHFLGFRP